MTGEYIQCRSCNTVGPPEEFISGCPDCGSYDLTSFEYVELECQECGFTGNVDKFYIITDNEYIPSNVYEDMECPMCGSKNVEDVR